MATQIDTYALTTLDNVRDFMSFDYDRGDVPDDDLIVALINRVSAAMETYCDRKFKSREYTEYHDGQGSSYLHTNQYPITTISGIWDDSTWVWDSTVLTAAADYRISSSERKVLLKDATFYDYIENVKIIYTAGYATIPYDLEDACIKQIAAVFKVKEDIHVFSKSLEDGSVERYQTAFLPSVKLILDSYRNRRVA